MPPSSPDPEHGDSPPTDARPIIALTGSTGFVGRQLAAALVAHGYPLRCFSRRPGEERTVARDDRANPPLDDPAAWSAALVGVDTVIHLAALTHRDDDALDDDELERVNAAWPATLATAAATAGVRLFLFFSSIAVAGPDQGRAHREEDDPAPVTRYGQSKLAAEEHLRALHANGEAPANLVILRPTLVHGPGAPGNLERLERLVQRLPVLPLGGFRAPRHLLGIDNLTDAVRTVVAHPAPPSGTYQLCDTEETSTAEIVRLMARAQRRRRLQLAVPPGLLRGAAGLADRVRGEPGPGKLAGMIAKLDAPMRVDNARFRTAFAWSPPLTTPEGLQRAFARRAG